MSTRAGLIALLIIGGILGAIFSLVACVSTMALPLHRSAGILGLVGALTGTLVFFAGVARWARRQRPPRQPTGR